MGFGSKEGSVTLDGVRILSDLAPVAIDDHATLTQGEAIALTILNNDSPTAALNPLSIQITTPTQNGTLTPNADGTVTYTPKAGFSGTDIFSYTVQSVAGERSKGATVTLTVNNAAPVITNLTKPNTIQEGTPTQLTAIATDRGNDSLSYTWDFGDGTVPVVGDATINHTYADDGNYTATVTVTNSHGAKTTQSIALSVNNVAPTITQWTIPAVVNEGMTTNFSAIATDPGRDTLTYSWDFGDRTAPKVGAAPTHTFTQPGTYTVKLTVSDEDGGSTQTTQTIRVDRFAEGTFIVGSEGKVSLDYLHDGGVFQPEVGIFSLAGMEHLAPGSAAFIKEAARRALSNSQLGYTVLRDAQEGARFTGGMGEIDYNKGTHQGEKTFALAAGTRFAILLTPNATLRDAFTNPNLTGNRRPLFSLSAANPLSLVHLGDANSKGTIFGFETLRLDQTSDRDYNDIVFRLSGAAGRVRSIDSLVAPSKDWRTSQLGQQILNS